MRFKSNIIAFAVTFLNIVCPFAAHANQCRNILPERLEDQVFFQRNKAPKTLNWKSDADYLTGYLTNGVVGTTRNFFSSRWDTQVYFSSPGTFPGTRLRELSLVDKNARGVFVWVHGSGTVKSGGRNFFANMNVMSNLGFSNVAIDFPFHSNGPTKDQFYDASYTINWFKNIILDIKASGKPVYLVGHSFGPDLISEVVSRHPFLVEGFVGLSPVGFNRVLENWYEKKTEKMDFGGDVMSSELAGRWAGTVTNQFGWNLGRYEDPTAVNPHLRARFLTGDMEEYVPAPTGGASKTPIGKNTYDITKPLSKFFKNAVMTVEPGVGHFIFNHKDANGDSAILREVLAVHGMVKPAGDKNLLEKLIPNLLVEVDKIRNLRSNVERIADLYQGDTLFFTWLNENYGGRKNDASGLVNRILIQEDNKLGKIILDGFTAAKKARDQEIILAIKNTKVTHPAYYEANKEKIEKGDPTLFPSYALYIYGISISP